MDYHNKVILITGASSGIGRAVALRLAPYNNQLILTARRKQLLKAVAADVISNGSEALCMPGDATDGRHAEAVVQQAISKYGKIDIAILNVGAGPASNSLTASAASITQCMRTNYDTMVNFYVPLMKQMRQQTTPCMIAHVNSLATYFGIPMQGDYTAAKAAARIFLETARIELQHFGIKHIRLQTIHPGFVDAGHSGDGVPAPNQITADSAAQYILRGLKTEVRENRFPLATALATRVGRIMPFWLRSKVLRAMARAEY